MIKKASETIFPIQSFPLEQQKQLEAGLPPGLGGNGKITLRHVQYREAKFFSLYYSGADDNTAEPAKKSA